MLKYQRESKLRLSNRSKLVVYLITLLIILTALSVIATGLDNPIITLGNGNSEEIITFQNGGGTNTDLNLTIPEGAIITDAEMELEGRGLSGALQPYRHDYQDTVNNNAWKGATTQNPPTSAPNTFMTTTFTSTEYTQISLPDNILAKHQIKGLNNYPYHLFRFNITETGITSLEVYWEGYGYFNGMMLVPYWSYGFVWNSNTNSWVSIGTNFTVGLVSDFVIRNNSLTPPGDYIDSNGHVFMMVQGTGIVDAAFNSEINTDYTYAETWATGISYPTDPSLDVGDDGDTEWSNSGKFDTNVIIGDNYDFKDELQSLVDAAAPGSGMVDITLKFTSITAGKIKISNISISYEFPEVNLAPYLHEIIPNGTYGFYEDTDGGDNLIDLNEYFWDDRDNGSLIYTILKNNDEIFAAIDDDGHHLNFTNEQDYFGTLEFQIRAIDKGLDGAEGGDTDLYTDGNIFSVTVWPTNDAPVIDSVGGKNILAGTTELEFIGVEGAWEDEWFNMTILGHDIDGDTVTFTVNKTLTAPAAINIIPDPANPDAAQLAMLASNDYIGFLLLNVTVNDNNATGTPAVNPSKGPLTASINLKIEVRNTNDAPYFDQIPDQIVDEDTWLNFTVTANDDDIGYGDALEFATNITAEIDGLDQGENFEFDKNTGELSILTDNDMVGIYWVNFDVNDNSYGSDSVMVKIIVRNINDLPVPVISAPLHQEAFNTTASIFFDGANTTDDDLIHGDILSYHWSSNGNDTLSTEPQFFTTLSEVGWHNITLTVKDGSNTEVTTEVSIKIAPAANGDDEPPPDDEPPDDEPQSQSDDEDTDGFYIGILILVIVVVVVIVAALFVIMQRRKLEREVEQELQEQEGQLQAPTPLLPMIPPPHPQIQQPMPIAQPIAQPPMVAPPQPQMPAPMPMPQMQAPVPQVQPQVQPQGQVPVPKIKESQ